jgi:hypothetical protein
MSFSYFTIFRATHKKTTNSKNENNPITITDSHTGTPNPKPRAKTTPSRNSNGLMELHTKPSLCGAIRKARALYNNISFATDISVVFRLYFVMLFTTAF